ncbi:hypothetical protein KM043_013306 [Ampulex compressa]|nr:hypothetical protein KM043_013306 [Ampulex compressa]
MKKHRGAFYATVTQMARRSAVATVRQNARRKRMTDRRRKSPPLADYEQKKYARSRHGENPWSLNDVGSKCSAERRSEAALDIKGIKESLPPLGNLM